MIDITLFEELKNYLTKEFMSLSRRKDEKLAEKMMLEVERQQKEQQLFDNMDTSRIKRLFSPLDDDIFEKEDFGSYRNNKILQNIQKIENEVDEMDLSMEDIKKYLCFIQMLENNSRTDQNKESDEAKQQENDSEICMLQDDKEEDSIQGNHKIAAETMSDSDISGEEDNEPDHEILEERESDEKNRTLEKEESGKEKKDISPNIKATLEDTAAFLQERYPNTEILLDFDDHGIITGKGLNRYFIRILTYTISASIEASNVDTVILEGEIMNGKVVLSLQMLLENHIVDQYSYRYEILLKEENL